MPRPAEAVDDRRGWHQHEQYPDPCRPGRAPSLTAGLRWPGLHHRGIPEDGGQGTTETTAHNLRHVANYGWLDGLDVRGGQSPLGHSDGSDSQ
jgi:hypothetical protein